MPSTYAVVATLVELSPLVCVVAVMPLARAATERSEAAGCVQVGTAKEETVLTHLEAAQAVEVPVPVAAAAPTIVVPFDPHTYVWFVRLVPMNPSAVGTAPATPGIFKPDAG